MTRPPACPSDPPDLHRQQRRRGAAPAIALAVLVAGLAVGCGSEAADSAECPATSEALRDALRGRTGADGPLSLCPGTVYDGPLDVPPGVTLLGRDALVRATGTAGVRLASVARVEDLRLLVTEGSERGTGLVLDGEGAAATRVSVALSGTNTVGVAVTASAATLRDVRINAASDADGVSSPRHQVGLWLVGADGPGEVSAQTLAIDGIFGFGLISEAGTRLSGLDVAVTAVRGIGLWVRGGTATLDGATIRSIAEPDDAPIPRSAHGTIVSEEGTLVARNTAVLETGGSGLVVLNGNATLERSGILATGGPGVLARGAAGGAHRLVLTDVAVREVRGAAIDAEEVRLRLDGLFLDQVGALAVPVDELRIEPMADALQLRSNTVESLRSITATGFGRLGLGLPADATTALDATVCGQATPAATRWSCTDEPDATVCTTAQAPPAAAPWDCRYAGDRIVCSASGAETAEGTPVLLPEEAPLADACAGALRTLLDRTVTGFSPETAGWAAIIGEDGTLGQRPTPLNAGAIQQRETLAWECGDDGAQRTCSLTPTGLRLASRDTPVGWAGGAWRCILEDGTRTCRDTSVALLEDGTIRTPAQASVIDGEALRARTALRSGETLPRPRFPLELPVFSPAPRP